MIFPTFKRTWLLNPHLLPGIQNAAEFSFNKFYFFFVEPLRFLFFDKGKFILTACIFFAAYFVRPRVNWLVSFLWLACCVVLFRASVYLPPESFFLFVLLFVISSFILLAHKDMRVAPFVFFLSTVYLLSISFFAIRVAPLPRYWLLYQPFYFLIAAASLLQVCRKRQPVAYGLAFCFIVLSLFGWSGYRKNHVGWQLETNLEYLDQVKTHQAACRFIEENFPESTVLTSWPQVTELTYPYCGYVKKPIKTIELVYYRGDKDEDIDLIYFSPQSYEPQMMQMAMKRFQLEEIRNLSRMERRRSFIGLRNDAVV